jgi:hypothetical protein
MMIKLELTYWEAETLHKILCEHLSDIASESNANAIEDFTDLLKREELSIQHIVDALQAQGIDVSAEMFGGYSE